MLRFTLDSVLIIKQVDTSPSLFHIDEGVTKIKYLYVQRQNIVLLIKVRVVDNNKVQ